MLGAVLVLLGAASCLVGVRGTEGPPAAERCTPRWAAEGDPGAPAADEARRALEEDLPQGARALLPARALRLSEGCAPLRLPIRIRAGRCYLVGFQIAPTGRERPWALLRLPDPNLDVPREQVIEDAMTTTVGEGADPVCYDDSFDGEVEVSVRGQRVLVWLQAYEVSPEAAARWADARRLALISAAEAAAAAAAEAEAARQRAAEACAQAADAGVDGGVDGGLPPDAGVVCPEPTADAGDAGPEAGPCADPDADCDVAWIAEIRPPSPPVPAGPPAVELPAQCHDGADNDQDGSPDCADPDCEGSCTRGRSDRAPWPRVIDLRVGGAYRVAGGPFVAEESLDPAFAPLESYWGVTTQASAVWRPGRYLGVGLDLGLGALGLRAWEANGGFAVRTRVTALNVSLGLSLQVSVPVWIMEIGGSVGLGWLHLAASGTTQSQSGDDATWYPDPLADQSFDHPYGSGWIWVDFWLRDYIALGVYGGALLPLTDRPELVANDYHVGLRTTLRLGL